MKNRLIGILGLGIFGSTIAKTLEEYDVDVIAIDREEDNVNRLANVVTRAVVGDITDESLLEAVGIGDCDAVVIATGESLEASSLGVMLCRRFGVKRIICKAKNKSYAEILKAVGATTIVLPEKESGTRLAKALMRDNVEDVLSLDDDTSVIEFHPPMSWVGRKLYELDLRNQHGINLIGYRDRADSSLNISIEAATVIEEAMILVGLTSNENLENHDFLTK